MADSSVKTNIMVALGEALSAITELKSVNRFRGKPIDLDEIALPALYFYDETEQRRRSNRLQDGIIDLVMSVFMAIPEDELGTQSFSDIADTIQAEIHGVMFGTKNLRFMGVKMVQEDVVTKEYPNGLYGVLTLRFTLTYTHKFGDAFTTEF
jgi:hypothetical protein